MARRIRPAIHYQHPSAPVRLLADKAIPGVARAFHQTLKLGRRLFDKKRAAQLIGAGHYDEVASLIGWNHHDEAMRRPLGLLGNVYHQGARIGARKINGAFTSRRRVVRYRKAKEAPITGSLEDYLLAQAVRKDASDLFEFNQFDPVTEQSIRDYQDALLQTLTADQRAGVLQTIIAGVQNGKDPDEIANDIALKIGLTPQQAAAVTAFRMALEQGEYYRNMESRLLSDAARATALAAAGEGQTQQEVTQGRIDQAVADYSDRQLASRAQTIATTETTRAASMGLQGAYMQAVDRGVMPMEAVTQRWQISLDEKTCPLCLSIVDKNPDGVGLDEQFDSDDGPIDAPPAHPNCRCSIEIVTNLDLVPDDEDTSMDFAMRFGKAYSEDEERDDHGRWTSGGAGGGKAADDKKGRWGDSTADHLTAAQARTIAKDWSVDAHWENYQMAAKSIAGGATREEFVADNASAGTRYAGAIYDRTTSVLAAINNGPDAGVTLYRGLDLDRMGPAYKVGDTFSESLASWTGDPSLASAFANGDFGPRGGGTAYRQPVVMSTVSSDNSKGIDLSSAMTESMFDGNEDKAKVFMGAQEWLTSGEYRVTKVAPGPVTHLTVERVGPAKLADMKKAYSDDEARDDHGRWTSGGAGGSLKPVDAESMRQFFSGNTDDLSFGDARAALDSPGQARVEQMSHEVDHALGLKASDTGALGAWSDGAENSVMTTIDGASWDQVRLSAAMKGSLADQKAVLAFREGDGDDSLLEFHATGSLDDIHAGLLKDGLAFHTLIPTSSGARVIVVASSEEDADNVAKAAGRYGADVSFRQGQAEFIGVGGDGTREQAQQTYKGVIDGSGVQGAGAIWQGLRDRWGNLATVAKRLIAWVVAA